MYGVDITKLPPNTQLLVETKNCLYNIEIIDPEKAEIIITGGATFTNPCKGTFQGCCNPEVTYEHMIQYDMSMIIKYKPPRAKKSRTVETDQVISVKLIAADGSWSFVLWE